MDIKIHFCVQKQHNTPYVYTMYCTFVQPSLEAGNSLKYILGVFQDGVPLVAHSQILSTFQDGGRVKFPTLGIVVDVKTPTIVRFTKSNFPGSPPPNPRENH